MTATFPRPSKILIAHSQDGGGMRSTVKLNLEHDLHSEFVPTEVTTLGHASGAPSSTTRPRGPCLQNEVLPHRPPFSRKGTPARQAGLVL
jgi:hypothetical protein